MFEKMKRMWKKTPPAASSASKAPVPAGPGNAKPNEYYQFKSGRIFRRNGQTGLFELLEDGKWVVSGALMDKFYDAASEYTEISGDEFEAPPEAPAADPADQPVREPPAADPAPESGLTASLRRLSCLEGAAHVFAWRQTAVYFQGKDGRMRDERNMRLVCKNCGLWAASPQEAAELGTIEDPSQRDLTQTNPVPPSRSTSPSGLRDPQNKPIIDILGVQCSATGVFQYSFLCGGREIFTAGYLLSPSPDVRLDGFGRELHHPAFDPDITRCPGVRREILDQSGRVYSCYEYLAMDRFALRCGPETAAVSVYDWGWEIHAPNGSRLAAILRLGHADRKRYEENGMDKETRFRVVLSPETPEVLLPLILSIPLLGF